MLKNSILCLWPRALVNILVTRILYNFCFFLYRINIMRILSSSCEALFILYFSFSLLLILFFLAIVNKCPVLGLLFRNVTKSNCFWALTVIGVNAVQILSNFLNFLRCSTVNYMSFTNGLNPPLFLA